MLKEYIKHIRTILEIIKKIELHLESIKLEFYIEETKFIEYIIRKGELRVDLKKI
jgi:hypothetical protein